MTATVADLIATLSTLPQDAVVVMAKDAEGNGFSPLATQETGPTAEHCWYEPETTWSGEIYGSKCDGAAVEAVCLWPVN